MQATFVAGTPAVTRTVVDAPAKPAKVVVEMSVEAAGWLMAFAGDHNGYDKINPIDGLYQQLERIPEVSAASALSQPRLRVLMERYNAGNRVINVFAVR